MHPDRRFARSHLASPYGKTEAWIIIDAAPGAIVCPAGLPHAIGQDIFLIELQEPTDLSVLLEWEGYADDFFAAERIRPAPAGVLDPAFSVLVIVDGSGRLETEHGGATEVRSGQTLLIPYAAGNGVLRGDLTAIRCRPPTS